MFEQLKPASQVTIRSRPQNCAQCPFKSRTCGSKGPINSPFVIVGESPGNTEIRMNLPFVGDSGKFLVERFPEYMKCEPYYTNSFVCLPKPKASSDEKMDACVSCSKRLHDEIKAYPREIILALGNGAVWGLTGDTSTKITKIRGTVIPSALAKHGIVACVHPAFLLRGGGSQRLFKADIDLTFSLLNNGVSDRKFIEADCILMETEDDIRQLINDASKQEFIAGDIETSDLKYLRGHILSQGFCWDAKEAYIVPPKLFKYLGPIYDRSTVKAKWIWHNGKFDVGWLRYESEFHSPLEYAKPVLKHTCFVGGDRKGYEQATVDEDTMLMSYAIEETRGIHGLEQVASDHLGAPNWKDMLESWLPKKEASYANVPPLTLYLYQAKDLGSTLQCFYKLRDILHQDERSRKLYERTLIPANEPLLDMERNGFGADRAQIEKNRQNFTAAKQIALDKVNAISMKVLGQTINPGSWQQVQKLLYKGGLDLANGKILATDKDTLEQELDNHPAVMGILAYRSEAKALGTYVDGLEEEIDTDGRIHASYLLHGTSTGRLASRNPNLQNIDREGDIRNQFTAQDGNILYELDLNQAELRCLACLSACPTLLSIYLDGKDSIHNVVSRKFFKGWEPKPSKNYDHEKYMLAKTITFGIVYGREAFGLSKKFDIPVREAQAYIDGWFEQFPGAHDFIEKCRRAPMRGVVLRTPFGRQRRFGYVSPEKEHDVANQAANFPHQSIASDITLHGAIQLLPTFRRWNVKIVNLIHDAIVVEMKDDADLIGSVRELGKKTLEAIPPQWGMTRVPFLADGKKGIRWGDFKDDN